MYMPLMGNIETGEHRTVKYKYRGTWVLGNIETGDRTVGYVTHLHKMSRMSALYQLRKWAICMIWADNSEFCFLSNFDVLKPRITILRSEMGSTPQY